MGEGRTEAEGALEDGDGEAVEHGGPGRADGAREGDEHGPGARGALKLRRQTVSRRVRGEGGTRGLTEDGEDEPEDLECEGEHHRHPWHDGRATARSISSEAYKALEGGPARACHPLPHSSSAARSAPPILLPSLPPASWRPLLCGPGPARTSPSRLPAHAPPSQGIDSDSEVLRLCRSHHVPRAAPVVRGATLDQARQRRLMHEAGAYAPSNLIYYRNCMR